MSWLNYWFTVAIIALTIGELMLLDKPASWRPISQWLITTGVGSPVIMFLVAFVVGGWLGYMTPPRMMAVQHIDLTRETSAFCRAVVVSIIAWDCIAVYFGGLESSVSKWTQTTAFESPVATAGAGFLAGHFFDYWRR